MHSANLAVHLQGEIPKIQVRDFGNFFTVEIIFDKYTVQLFFNLEQELTNFKNNFIWAFEKPLDLK